MVENPLIDPGAFVIAPIAQMRDLAPQMPLRVAPVFADPSLRESLDCRTVH
ncbi:MAG: hypothetical protein WDM81_21130 [Rhizomicrobium sp.]